LSLILPVIILPIQWHSHLTSIEPFANTFSLQANQPDSIITGKSQLNPIQTHSGLNVQLVLLYVFFIAYIIGLAYRLFGFAQNLDMIFKFIKQNPKEKENNYWIIRLKNEMPAFSFFNYIFINDNYKNLAKTDLQVIKNHEIVHVKQNHTLDILFFELVSIVFWFNPAMKYLRKSLQEVHEYIVDEKIAGHGEQKKAYAQLLLNLASEAKTFNLVASFTGEHIKRRILMVAKPKTSARYKLLFSVLVPLTAIILLSFSFIHNDGPEVKTSQQSNSQLTSGNRIGTITWVGNNIYSTDTLNKLLGLKKGDYFSFDELSKSLSEGVVSTHYFDNNYVFYKADFATNLKGNREYDITITVSEGLRGKIGTVSVTGNTTVPIGDILKNTKVKTGDLFTKTEIVKTVQAIGNMGKFVPEKTDVHVNPQGTVTDDGYAIINLEFVVVEK
jgi:beta-lactamase regulating signal transducer with metallopeptidase domain